VPLPRSDNGFRLTHESARAIAVAVAMGLGAGGCGGYFRAEIHSLAPRGAYVDRGRPVLSPPEHRTRRSHRLVAIDASRATGRAELGLLKATLAFAEAMGASRLASLAVSHFESHAAGTSASEDFSPGVCIKILRGEVFGDETWFVDSQWIVRELRNGALLAWEGDFAQVIATIDMLVPVRSRARGL
jgi:hypothetical protein